MDFYKGITKKVVSLFVLLALFTLFPKHAFADNTTGRDCTISIDGTQISGNPSGLTPLMAQSPTSNGQVTLGISVTPGNSDFKDVIGSPITLYVNKWGTLGTANKTCTLIPNATGNQLSCNIKLEVAPQENANFTFDVSNGTGAVCKARYAQITAATTGSTGLANAINAEKAFCGSIAIFPTSTGITESTNVSFTANLPAPLQGNGLGADGKSRIYKVEIFSGTTSVFSNSSLTQGLNTFAVGKLSVSDYKIVASASDGGLTGSLSDPNSSCIKYFSVGTSSKPGAITETGTSGTNPPAFNFCNQANSSDRDLCTACYNKGQLWTALGCIPTSTQGIVQSLLTVGLGLSGGVVLLSIIVGAFMMATSAGEPKKVQEAQEMISAAIIGLLFVIFSVIILNFVGVSILHIPGFA